MAVRAQESEILTPAIVGLAVYMVNVQREWLALPTLANAAGFAHGIDTNFDQCSAQ